MNVFVQQDSSRRRTGWWDWSVWLSGSDADLEQIKLVEYVLHPTFPEPVQRRADRNSGFRLDGSGWGEFLIHINLFAHDGTVSRLEHWLRLGAAASQRSPLPAAEEPRVSKDAGMKQDSTSTSLLLDLDDATVKGTVASRPKLCLSYAVADTPVGEDLRDALAAQGFDVLLIDSLLGEQSSEALRADPNQRVQGAVFVVSDVRNPWLAREVAAARAAELPMVAVMVGEHARVPVELADAQQVYVKDALPIGYAAESIAERLWQASLKR